MRGRVLSLMALMLVTGPALATAAASPQEQIDRIAAIVNGEVITLGEARRAMALQSGERLSSLGLACGEPIAGEADGAADGTAERAILECLIDATLGFQEVRRFPQLGVTVTDVDETYRRLAAEYVSRQAFEAELSRWGLTPAGVREDLERQLLVAAYVETRFRSFTDISEQATRDYYEDVLVPDMLERGISPPALEAVRDEFILPILREIEVNRRLRAWVTDLRRRARIGRMLP